MRAQQGLLLNSATTPRPGRISARSSNRPVTRAVPEPRSPMRAPISPDTSKATQRTRVALWLAWPVALGLLATAAKADPLQIVGYSGYLGEWELTATVADDGSSAPKQYSGALAMKHVGLCTQEGPEEKSGRMRIRMAPSATRLEA